MKSLITYISEKMIYNKANASKYKYFPKTKKELQNIIAERIIDKGNDVDLNDIDVSKITDMHMLFGQLPDFCGDVSEWDVSNVTDMSTMFADLRNFDCDLSNWNTSNVENMANMFKRCTSFKGTGLKDWNVKKVRNTTSMFSNCTNFNENLSNWKFDSIYNTSYMFSGCHKFTGEGLENWDITNAVTVESMFLSCNKFNIDVSNFKICGKTDSLHRVFQYCLSFEGKGLDKWILHKSLSYIDSMFEGCLNLDSKYLVNWDLSNTKIKDISYMFADCPKFKGHLLNDWKLNKDTSMYSAFANCFSKPDWYIEEE